MQLIDYAAQNRRAAVTGSRRLIQMTWIQISRRRLVVDLGPIPFNRPHVTGKEHAYIDEAVGNHQLSGDGPFTKRCHQWMERETGCAKALLTPSCTAALELAALLLDLEPGDEVI